MWSNIATSNGHETAPKLRDYIIQFMTKAQVSEAQQMASDWLVEFEKRDNP